MECLFQTVTKNTYAEYKKFCWASNKLRKTILHFVILETLIVLLGWYNWYRFNSVFYVFGIVYPVIVLVSLLLHNRHIKKVFESNKALKDTDMLFEFYDTYFVATDKIGASKIEYDVLYKMIETKTNFYLLIAKNQGFILIKENFPDGLADFLRNKVMV